MTTPSPTHIQTVRVGARVIVQPEPPTRKDPHGLAGKKGVVVPDGTGGAHLEARNNDVQVMIEGYDHPIAFWRNDLAVDPDA